MVHFYARNLIYRRGLSILFRDDQLSVLGNWPVICGLSDNWILSIKRNQWFYSVWDVTTFSCDPPSREAKQRHIIVFPVNDIPGTLLSHCGVNFRNQAD